MIGPWREMLTTTVKCPCGQKGRWQRMTKVYEDSEPEWEHSCDRCMFGGHGVQGDPATTRSSSATPVVAGAERHETPAKSRKSLGSQLVHAGWTPPVAKPETETRTTKKPRKDRKPLPAPIEQKVCSRCGIVFRGYREHCVKCRRWGEPGRPPIPENEKPLNPGSPKA